MSTQPRRITTTLAITGASQEVSLPLTIGKINHLVVTSTESQHTFDMSLINEKSDTLYGPVNITCPSNDIRPELLPIGVLTFRAENPIPDSGTITIVAIIEEK